jgi:hypothetical protein
VIKKVDAVVVIARLQLLRFNTVAEQHRLLSTMRPDKLGSLLATEKALAA